jgi:hypothetical protein
MTTEQLWTDVAMALRDFTAMQAIREAVSAEIVELVIRAEKAEKERDEARAELMRKTTGLSWEPSPPPASRPPQSGTTTRGG